MIYLDFEGYMKQSPSLVGVQLDGEFKQIILDEDFSQIAKETDIEFQNYDQFCIDIIAISNLSGQPITAWSENELDIFKAFKIPFDYCNLLKEAKLKIKNNPELDKKHKEMKEYWVGQRINRAGNLNPHHNIYNQKKWKLITILKLLEYPGLNSGYGNGKVTKRLTSIRNGLIARGSFKLLTKIQKSKWTKLLSHNRVDVVGMLFI